MAKARFCVAGHDTQKVGRTQSHTCQACMKQFRQNYRQSIRGKAAERKYKQGSAGRATAARSRRSSAGKLRQARYRKSIRGMLTRWADYIRCNRRQLQVKNETR